MRVTLHFDLDEEVTPDLFAGKVASACSEGALRPGESVFADEGTLRYTINEMLLLDDPLLSGLL